jgi:hypothetical protein
LTNAIVLTLYLPASQEARQITSIPCLATTLGQRDFFDLAYKLVVALQLTNFTGRLTDIVREHPSSLSLFSKLGIYLPPPYLKYT